MIKMMGLCAGYPDRPVLNRVDLTVPSGAVTVIVGPNGCGKSTLLKVLVGIIPKSDGEIFVDGCDVNQLTTRERAQKIAYLAQSKQISEITAFRMVLHGRFPYLGYPRRYRPQDMEIVREAMARLGIEELADQPMNTLSGGTRQKVYIAMALAQDTPVILMDEPTTFLDVAYQFQMMEQARTLANEGKAVVMVLHDLPMALEHADRMIVMKEGRIVTDGKPAEVFAGGCLNEVFGVKVSRVETPDGWKYYCLK